MRAIIVVPSENIEFITDFLDFNSVPYTQQDVWNDELGMHDISSLECSGSVLVLYTDFFRDLLDSESGAQKVIDFCQRDNRIWVWADIDGFLFKEMISDRVLEHVDANIPANSIDFFFDDRPDTNNVLYRLKNIKFHTYTYSKMIYYPRIRGATIKKFNPTHDYLLTMRKKNSATVHRDILWRHVSADREFMSRGHAVYHQDPSLAKEQYFVGDRPPHSQWWDGFPSMDLYRDVWFEIVPETFYKNGWSLSEKTIKPMATNTPFLVVSTPGYLDYMREFGFLSFSGVIDESYDDMQDVEERVARVVDLARDIICNGSEDFYHACRPILDHNQKVLGEICGRWQYEMDLFIQSALETL